MPETQTVQMGANNAVLFEQMRPNGEKVVAAVNIFKGTTYISIRVYYEDKATGEWKPGKNGINLPFAEIDSLIGAGDRVKQFKLEHSFGS